jgi:hypothetical protein
MMTTHGNPHGIQRLLLPLLIFGVAGTWHQAWAADFLCRNGDLTRRVEVSPGDAARNVACEVRYWRNAAIASGAQVLWRATQDTAFCDAKARRLLDDLEAGGWSCAARDQPARSEAIEEAPPPAPGASAAPAPAQEPPLREARLPAEPAPAAAPRAEPPAQARQPAAPAASRNPAAGRNVALLDRVVDETLRSVQQLYGGDFRAEDTAFGDLDGDGRDDAAILVTYEADRDDYVQYLVAYLFDGQTYRSSATKNVGGRFLDVQRAEVQGIVDRSIVVVLQALDEDAACCEPREVAFALEDGQLVEVEKPPGP